MYWTEFGSRSRNPFFSSSFFAPTIGMRNLQQEMNRLFDGAFNESGSNYPSLDLFANENEVVLRAELPGMKPDEFDLSVVGATLTLKGERKSPFGSSKVEEPSQGHKFLRREREFGSFSRTIELPFPVEAEAVSAEYRNGVLQVTLPRAASDKPKKITIR